MAYTEAAVLSIVKQRLNRIDTALDTHLTLRIAAAAAELERNGIVLVDDVDDNILLADYTTWRYQNRDSNTGMPEWLRLARRERFLSSKGRGSVDT